MPELPFVDEVDVVRSKNSPFSLKFKFIKRKSFSGKGDAKRERFAVKGDKNQSHKNRGGKQFFPYKPAKKL